MIYTTKELRGMGVTEDRVALRQFRREHKNHRGKKLGQGEAAAMIGINKETLARYERGETRYPRAGTVERIRAFLKRWKAYC